MRRVDPLEPSRCGRSIGGGDEGNGGAAVGCRYRRLCPGLDRVDECVEDGGGVVGECEPQGFTVCWRQQGGWRPVVEVKCPEGPLDRELVVAAGGHRPARLQRADRSAGETHDELRDLLDFVLRRPAPWQQRAHLDWIVAEDRPQDVGRVDAEVEVWKHRDPVERVKSLLVHEYKVKKTALSAVTAEADAMALKLREDVLAMGRPDPITMFDHAYAAPHPLIEEGRREMIDMGISGGSH